MFTLDMTDSKNNRIQLYTSVTHRTFNEYLEYPEFEENYDFSPIRHGIKLVASLDMILDETKEQDIEEKLKAEYYLDDESNELVIAKISITEFPAEWKENMEDSWFMWLDTLDGDHCVIGSRADEIEEQDLYDDPFSFGSLFYIERIDVHPKFRGQHTGINLIQYTFKHLIRNANGMVFLIAKPMQSTLSKKKETFKSQARLAKYYEKCGFKRVSKKKADCILMETNLQDLVEYN
ncbi:hypothetical protein SAMN04487969_12653 [Paenibacillus algorifonticola]|uniref:N-acetyltransferase domain-containing protein n=1 Tax=Paenibacillus algorifonticola TaxID=684063 RepID=A0A1I2HVU3_9BACL|nr:GNAT family N-acetyltransferase [Paenibacillus algorifonticola]SFF32857.1 hypothetical protein SAMN04487969_12653 [Paenibacillus algorifonticola]